MIVREKVGSYLKLSFTTTPGRHTEDELETIISRELDDIADLCIDLKGVDRVFVTMVRIFSYAESVMRERGSFHLVNANEDIASLCEANGIHHVNE